MNHSDPGEIEKGVDPDAHWVVEWEPAAAAEALEADAVHVWRISIDEDQPAALREARRAILSVDECERADRFSYDEHRNQFIFGRGALRIILGRYLDRAPEDIVFDYEEHGKPIVREPAEAVGEASLRFNVTHSGAYALLGVTLARRIGIDIEDRSRRLANGDGDAIAERYFSGPECGKYRALPKSERLEAFFRCWTRKEAFIKAIGEGLTRPLSGFEVTLGPDEPPRLLRVDGHPGEESRWSLYSFEPAPGYTAALMMERERNDLSFFDFE